MRHAERTEPSYDVTVRGGSVIVSAAAIQASKRAVWYWQRSASISSSAPRGSGMHESGKPIVLRATWRAIQYRHAVPSLRTRPRLRPGAFPRGGMFTAPEVLRSVLGVRAKMFSEPIARIEPRLDRRVKAAARQWHDLRKAIALPDLESGTETVPAESGQTRRWSSRSRINRPPPVVCCPGAASSRDPLPVVIEPCAPSALGDAPVRECTSSTRSGISGLMVSGGANGFTAHVSIRLVIAARH
jgi:hypothetical protein